MKKLKNNFLYLVVLGGRAEKANVELHDVRWVVGSKIEDTYDTLKNDLNCDIKKSEFILEENYPLDLMLFFSDKVKPDYFSDCQIELKFSSLDTMPIEDSDSINKTMLDMTTKSFININFNKL